MYEKLYKGHKNSIGYWTIAVEENEEGHGVLTISHARAEGAKEVTNTRVIKKGKNLGKSNETTPYEQAVSEAKSKIEKQLDTGYERTPEDIGEFPKNQLGHPLPMLAKHLKNIKNPDFSEAYVQPKFDGHRCLSVRVGDDILMYSKEGHKIPTVSHIEEALKEVMEDGDYLDGELYIHGMTLQKISSLITRQQEDSKLLEYHVYDTVISDKSYRERFMDVYHTEDSTGPLKSVETYKVSSAGEAWRWFEKFVELGYEGAMVRLGVEGYEVGARSSSLLKLKGGEDEEFVVLAVRENDSRELNGIEYRQCSFVFETKEGKEFTAVAPGTLLEKHNYLLNPETAIGKEFTLEFANWTPDGKPFHPIVKRPKEYL